MFSHLKSSNNKAMSFFRKPAFTKRWFIPVWLMLGISRLMINTHLLSPQQEAQALRIARVIRVTARYCPWVANCFPQAMTARLLLGFYRIPYSLYFGLCRDPDTNEFKAHAWVTAGHIPVSGGQSFHFYTIVGCYLKPYCKVANINKYCP